MTSFVLDPREPLPDEVRRVVLKQAATARRRLVRAQAAPERMETAVHGARKQIKKIRAVLRLVRPALSKKVYRTENVAYRDIARRLAGPRDRAVQQATWATLTHHAAFPLSADEAARIGQLLSEAATEPSGNMSEIPLVIAELAAARERVAGWTLRDGDFAPLAAGLESIYRRGQVLGADARRDPSVVRLHEWRKQVKYLWHACQLLHPLWSEMVGAWTSALKSLADLLGDEHDLAELHARLAELQGLEEPVRATLQALIAAQQEELQAAAWVLGARLYAEQPAAFARRHARYWRIAQREGSAGRGVVAPP